jgi:hypothetical protein
MKTLVIIISLLFAFLGFAKAQSFNILLEPGAIKDLTGNTVGHSAGLTVWYAQTNFTADSLSSIFSDPLSPTLAQIAELSAAGLPWFSLDENSAGPGVDFWETPGASVGGTLPRDSGLAGSGQVRPIVAIFDGLGLDSLSAGDGFGLLLGNNFIGDLGPFTFQWPSNGGAFNINVGQSGSIQLASVVPEPSSFALIAGFFGLAWVMVRRRG